MLIATWNVNGLRRRADELLELLRTHGPDVVCLQEIKCTAEQVPDSLSPLALPDYRAMWHGGLKGYSGVALLLRKDRFSRAVEFGHPGFDRESRIVQARVGSTVFASFYVPNGGKDYDAKIAFLGAMVAWVGQMHAAGDALVVAGDLNVALTDSDMHPSQRKADVIGQRPDERALLQGVLDQGLADVCRRLRPDDDRMFTWWPYWKGARERNLGWRIDYVLASEAAAGRAESMQVLREFGSSDHAPVIVRVAD